MTLLREIIFNDDYLTSNIKPDGPDFLGLEGDGWAGQYDMRIKQIQMAVSKALVNSDRAFNGIEVAELINDYQHLVETLKDHKQNWLDYKDYDMQDHARMSYRDLLDSCCPKAAEVRHDT